MSKYDVPVCDKLLNQIVEICIFPYLVNDQIQLFTDEPFKLPNRMSGSMGFKPSCDSLVAKIDDVLHRVGTGQPKAPRHGYDFRLLAESFHFRNGFIDS